MNILQGIKPTQPVTPNQLQAQKQPSTKFIIKSKHSTKENKLIVYDNDLPETSSTNYASDQDIHQLITYLVNKSKRLQDILESKGVQMNVFSQKYLYDNACIRTFLKSFYDKLLAQRRLGKSLKGINKGILTEIQNALWSSLEREVALYQLDKLYQIEKTNLEQQLESRRKELEREIETLKTENLESQLINSAETSNPENF